MCTTSEAMSGVLQVVYSIAETCRHELACTYAMRWLVMPVYILSHQCRFSTCLGGKAG